jgi:hypothetical protein
VLWFGDQDFFTKKTYKMKNKICKNSSKIVILGQKKVKKDFGLEMYEH